MKAMKTLMVTAVLAVLALTGCTSKDNSLLATIPADATVTARFDIKTTLDGLGFDTKGQEWRAPEWVDNEHISTAQIHNLQKLAGAVHNGHVVMVVPNETSPTWLATFLIDDTDALAGIMEREQAVKETTNGFTTYRLADGMTVAVKDRQAWLGSGRPGAVVAAITRLEKACREKGSLEGNEAVEKAFSGDGPVVVVMAAPNAVADDNHGGKPLLIANLATDALRLTADIKYVYPDDTPFITPGLLPIDPTTLQYIPANAGIAIALGMNGSDLDLSQASAMVPGMDMATRSMVNMLLEFLKGVDGTLMVALVPAEGYDSVEIFDTDSFRWMLMAHMPRQKLQQTIQTVMAMVGSYGVVKAKEVADGLYYIAFAAQEFYIGNVGGYFTVASYLPTDNNSNALAAHWSEKIAGMTVNLPDISRGVGVEASLTSTAEQCTMSMTITGTGAKTFAEAVTYVLTH